MVFLSRVSKPLLGIGVLDGFFFGLAQAGGRNKARVKRGEGVEEAEDEGEEEEEEEEGFDDVQGGGGWWESLHGAEEQQAEHERHDEKDNMRG